MASSVGFMRHALVGEHLRLDAGHLTAVRQHRIGYHSHQASSEPPYTRRLPLPAIHAPNSSTAFLYDGSLPSWAPRYTVMFIYRLSNVIALFDPLTVVPTIR